MRSYLISFYGQAPKHYPNFPSPTKNRNGPARQRRRAQREHACQDAVEVIEAGQETGVAGEAAKASEHCVVAEQNAGQTVTSLVNYELCNDSVYNAQNHPVEKETVKDNEVRDKLWKFVGKFKN